MIATGEPATHEDAWLSLPWLVNGRISPAERARVEAHIETCAACREELTSQRLLCSALTEPDRVTYAPGPSFRKLMHRIDGAAAEEASTGATRAAHDTRSWRPPGLAWAASVILAVGLTGAVTTLYRSSHAAYMTHTDTVSVTPDVLHIAFDRSLTVGDATEVLRSNGARIIEGPDSTGIIGVTANMTDAKHPGREMHLLAERLRADPRVRWVEPLP
ncbi:MAG TPA: zf-HC2 domain-containing protein [Steroidobacteraceae bacterium]|nr:zf-HC2 domain-containing protein [Steroidobacteraceae bacterium]